MIDNRTGFSFSHEIAPIVLEGGIASGVPGEAFSILTLTEGTDFALYEDFNQYFAHFKVLSGGTLQEWSVADYPFASMIMAANAVIKNALHISLMMVCPAQNSSNNYANKIAKMTSIKNQLDNHISQGGFFTVSTPAFTYSNCLLTSLRDVSSPSDKQVQLMYQWDFVQPLLTQSAANIAMNNLTNKFDKQLPTPNPITNSGLDVVVNNPKNTQPNATQMPANK
jgi:hypothetical protein